VGGNFEAFGTGFARTPQISLITTMELFKAGFEGAASALIIPPVPAIESTQSELIEQLRFARPTNVE
jgi:hypothetical protein